MLPCSFPVVYIGVDCLSRSVTSLYWPNFCFLRTFLRFFDAMIVSHIISWLYFLKSSLVVWHISAYSIQCLSPLFPTSSLPFFIRAIVGDDILDVSVLNRFLTSSWNSIFCDPVCVASTLGDLLIINLFPFHLYVQFLFIAIMWSLPMLTWLMTITSVTMSGLVVRM